MIWIYDFTHFRASKRCPVAVLDVVSRLWLATVVSAQESSTQLEVAFTRALTVEGKDHLLDAALLDELGRGTVPDHDELPVLLALSDNGPQMTSRSTKAFLAGARIATHFGRPGTPNDQAWIESFFGHLKGEHPHLDKIADPASWNTSSTYVACTTTLCDYTRPWATPPPTTSTTAAARPCARHDEPGSTTPDPPGLPATAISGRITRDPPRVVGY